MHWVQERSLIPHLSVTAGVRLDLEKDKLNYTYDILTAGIWKNKIDTVYPSLTGAKVLPKLTLNYQAGNSTFYATVANGYKTIKEFSWDNAVIKMESLLQQLINA